MKPITIRLPDALAAEIEAESRAAQALKIRRVRERLDLARSPRRRLATLDAIDDLIGSVDGLRRDLSVRKKENLRATGYGRKRPR